MVLYKLEKNIPITSCVNIEGRWKKLASGMEISDSILVRNDVEADRLCMALTRMKRKGTMRKENNSYRVWRIV